MELSVVVSTLNGRERLLPCLDALRTSVPASTEVVVVNGPSADGTTGAVRERDDVDVLVEISERNRNVSRNAGIEAATGDVVAFVGGEYAVDGGWYGALESASASGADVVTGPVRDGVGSPAGDDRSPSDPRPVRGRAVTGFDGDNVAFDREVIEALDGFDEYLETGGAKDCAHRVAAMGYDVTWSGGMAARHEVGTDGGRLERNWGVCYRSLGYRLAKNYGLGPTVLARAAGSALRDASQEVRAVATGDSTPTGWVGNGAAVVRSTARGLRDGRSARGEDGGQRRNPHGLSARQDRAVRQYDLR
ncbi:glycosyltransferase family 2 protein [Saliphagus sp. LR7]|uniref:glycosyltransferase family 2 protein n=1 Tax=Saliphagus sp. LR7 TaxID=2282654 RepID=UPI000DF77A58|nr:glycosyltransferase family A protein [Saliphagus sp. LR7]